MPDSSAQTSEPGFTTTDESTMRIHGFVLVEGSKIRSGVDVSKAQSLECDKSSGSRDTGDGGNRG